MSYQVFSARRESGYYDPEKLQRSSVRRRRSNKSSKGLWIAGAVILVLLCAAAAYFFYYKSDPSSVGSSEDIQIYVPEAYEIYNEESAFDSTAHGQDAEENVEVNESLPESEESRGTLDVSGMLYTNYSVPVTNIYLDNLDDTLEGENLENPVPVTSAFSNDRDSQNFDFQEISHENPSGRNTDDEDAENIANIHINEANNLTEQEHEELEELEELEDDQDYVEISDYEDEGNLEVRISDDFLVY